MPKYSIYALIDLRTGQERYVGVTKDVIGRLYFHMRDALLVAQGQRVSLAGLCQRTQLRGRVAGPFLRERQQGILAVAPEV